MVNSKMPDTYRYKLQVGLLLVDIVFRLIESQIKEPCHKTIILHMLSQGYVKATFNTVYLILGI